MLSSENGMGTGMYMPVAPAYGYGGNNGFGMNGDWAWIILLLLAFGGGWGNGFGGGFGGGDLYPWMNQSNQISGGFRDQMINDNVTGIRSDLGDIATQLCNGFNQTQMGMMQSTNGLQAQLANCCCENRLATQDLKYTIATEECATRSANAANVQAIMDKLCQLELDGKNDRIADLERQLTMANLAASQNAQTAAILANNEAQTTALEQYLAPIPRPAYVVQNPACCNQNAGCGCGNF